MAKPSSLARTQRRRSGLNSKPRSQEHQIAQAIAAMDQLDAKTPKAATVISLLRTWLGDESGYDEEAWPGLRKSLNRERARVAARSLFDE